MRPRGILLAVELLLFKYSYSTPVGNTQHVLQAPLAGLTVAHPQPIASQQLHGRFLHITDLHPDPFYKIHASTEEDDACHRGKGSSGLYGAETSDCDSPFALVNATFKWIAENFKDNVDFVVWTGDSARHDSDEKLPRTADEVLETNRWIAGKFAGVFSKSDDPTNSLTIPIVPTFGNNDILPHNILLSGPNKWLKTYTDIWSKFIPEEQRHGFERGGWFYVEVIPQKLAIFSLNTLYFFSHNAAVDGCALKSEPGFEHMEWLRIQLQFMRQRGMKAILTGHIPPARTESKQLWDETCWQKYTLWLRQYRDVVVGGLYGHMNIDHFMLHDTKQINILDDGISPTNGYPVRAMMDEELSIQSANDYLEELREDWSELPNPKLVIDDMEEEDYSPEETTTGKGKKHGRSKKKKKKDASKKLGGPWGERFHTTLVSPSIVPNFFPTIRVIEYNITGLDKMAIWANPSSWSDSSQSFDWLDEEVNNSEQNLVDDADDADDTDDTDPADSLDDENEPIDQENTKKGKSGKGKKKKKKGKKHKKKPSDPDLIVPLPPSKSSPPGPGYSPQTLTLLGYTQYFANLTHINNDNFVKPTTPGDFENDADASKWHEGKHKGKHPKEIAPHPKKFQFLVEYNTFTDPIYKLKDMTVRSYIKLAHRIGQYKPQKGDEIDTSEPESEDEVIDSLDDIGYNENKDGDDDEHLDTGKKGKKHRKKKHHRQHEKNKVWLRFIKRAFVGTLDEEELRTFESHPSADPTSPLPVELHDGEL